MYTATCGILLLGSDSQAKKAAQFTSVLQNILTQQKISRILFETTTPFHSRSSPEVCFQEASLWSW